MTNPESTERSFAWHVSANADGPQCRSRDFLARFAAVTLYEAAVIFAWRVNESSDSSNEARRLTKNDKPTLLADRLATVWNR
jgi:hypothetical protein